MPFVVGAVTPGSKNTALQPKDIILALNGQATKYFDQAKAVLESNKNKTIVATILRDDKEIKVPVAVTNDGKLGIGIGRLGMESLEKLLAHLKKTYAIPQANFIGHADIAPTRKNDPNINFDWKSLSYKGYGIWYGDTTNSIVPGDFKPLIALKVIGYDIKDSTAAILTFKRKFVKDETNKSLNTSDLKVLYGVWKEVLK